MRLKALIGILCLLMLSGCNTSRQIETASVIETVTVSRQNGALCYTFYKLSSQAKPPHTDIEADSFEQACDLARRQYIPHLSLAKLRLMMIDRTVSKNVLPRDIAYISTQTYFSPVAYVCLCDEGALRLIKNDRGAQSRVEEQLRLCQQQHPFVKLDYLSIFNSLDRQKDNSVSIACVNSKNELKANVENITAQNRSFW